MKNLSHKEYAPTLKPFNFKEIIQNQVDKESWSMVDIKQPELPKYEKIEMKWTSTVIEAFAKGISMFSI